MCVCVCEREREREPSKMKLISWNRNSIHTPEVGVLPALPPFLPPSPVGERALLGVLLLPVPAPATFVLGEA